MKRVLEITFCTDVVQTLVASYSQHTALVLYEYNEYNMSVFGIAVTVVVMILKKLFYKKYF
jgi:presenilin-like A22 family membrane protease